MRNRITFVLLAASVMALGAIDSLAEQVGVVIQPVTVSIRYGSTVIPAGTRLTVSSVDGSTVVVDYLGELHKIPLAVLRLEGAPAATTSAIPVPQPHTKPPPPPEAPQIATVTLQSGWDGPMQGGDIIMRELQELLSRHCSPGTDLGGGTPELYRGVRYLMPVAVAVQTLGLSHRIRSGERIVAAGFPKNSLSCSTFDGSFEGEFNRLELVTDAADRVVCLQLVNQAPRKESGGNDKWMTYNFLRNAMRAADTMKISADANRKGEAIIVETTLFQHYGRQHGNHFHLDRVERKEKNRLFIPIPFARLVLHCVENGLRK